MKNHLTIAPWADSGKKLFVVVCVILSFCVTPFPALAIKERQDTQSISDDKLRKTLMLLQAHSNPAAKKLLFWIYATQTNFAVSVTDLMAFHDNNPHWPGLWQVRQKIEHILWTDQDIPRSQEWFLQHPPQTLEGLRAAMRDAGSEAVLNTFWSEGLGDSKDAAFIRTTFGKKITSAAHIKRFNILLRDKRYTEAGLAVQSLPIPERAKAQARLALARLDKNASQLVNALTADMQNDPLVMLERFRWNVRKDRRDAAFAILKSAAQRKIDADLWWPEANILLRSAINEKNYARAHDISLLIPVDMQTKDWANIAWLQGWLALKQPLPQLPSAAARFEQVFNNAKSSITKSRGAYWRWQVAQREQDIAASVLWRDACLKYTTSFYGQACQNPGGIPPAPILQQTAPNPDPALTELKSAAYLLHIMGLNEFSDGFFASLLQDAADISDYKSVADLALQTGRPDWAVEANKRAQQNLAVSIGDAGYPRLPAAALPAKPDKALVQSIVYRESMFKQDAVSPAGAIGLMQLMPPTARAVAKQKKIPYRRDRLSSDASYNITLGAAYLQSLLDDYGGFYPLAIAAYNAGPGRVDGWIRAYGDPRDLHTIHDVIEWTEHIPIYETRNYVHRVIETIHAYDPDATGLTLFKPVSSKQ